MRFLLVALLWLIIFGTVDVASAETPQELTTQCQKGEAAACFNLGYMYGNGTGVTQDDFKAVELYRKACDGKDGGGCWQLGWMYEQGNGVRQSVADALTFYGKACDLKQKLGCEYYARLKTGKK